MQLINNPFFAIHQVFALSNLLRFMALCPVLTISVPEHWKVHNVQHANKKDAKEAARQAGQGEPIHHSSGGSGSSGHYHAADKVGCKREEQRTKKH